MTNILASAVHTVGPWCLAVLAGAMVVALFRLFRGPTGPDRVVALDLVTVLAAALLGGWALHYDERAYLVVALVIALVSFLGTVALALFVERTAEGRERENTRR